VGFAVAFLSISVTLFAHMRSDVLEAFNPNLPCTGRYCACCTLHHDSDCDDVCWGYEQLHRENSVVFLKQQCTVTVTVLLVSCRQFRSLANVLRDHHALMNADLGSQHERPTAMYRCT
jgi:hypothetical protein